MGLIVPLSKLQSRTSDALIAFLNSTNAIYRWKLDESNGTRSSSIGSAPLTDNNTVLSTTGYTVDTIAAQFVAANTEYLNGTISLSADTNLTVSMWIRRDGTSNGAGLFSLKSGATENFTILFGDGLGHLRYYGGASTGFGSIDSASTYAIGAWHHMVFVHNTTNNTDQYYFDGALSQNFTSQTYSIAACNTIEIGRRLTTYNDASMQDIIMWNTALTATDVAALYSIYT